MGKQIEFFISKLDENGFLQFVSDNNDLIMNDKADAIDVKDAIDTSALSLFIVATNIKVFKSNSGFLDSIVSEAIQFTRGFVNNEKTVRSGRLWAEFKYYDCNHQIVTKRKEFNEMFNRYVKWIKKNCKMSRCKKYYIGNHAYKLYKEEGFLMKAGSNYTVEFD